MKNGHILAIQCFPVVARDDGSHARGAAIAKLDGVSIENLAVLMLGREMALHEGKESLANIGFDPGIERRIEPDSVASSLHGSALLRVLKLMVEATALKGDAVFINGLSELVLVA